MMKNLNPREQRLAGGLCIVVFLMLNLLFLPKLIKSNRVGRQKNAEMQAQVTAANTWLAKSDYWNTRKAWLDRTAPSLHAAREDSANQLEAIQQSAQKFGLTISEVQLLQFSATEFYQPIGARLTVKGPWAGLVQLVSGLQNPSMFNVIPRFSVKSDESPSEVQCDLEVQSWFLISKEASQ